MQNKELGQIHWGNKTAVLVEGNEYEVIETLDPSRLIVTVPAEAVAGHPDWSIVTARVAKMILEWAQG